MTHFWHISEKHKDTAVKERFFDLDRTFSAQGERITRNPVGYVNKIKVGKHFYYAKLYTRGGKRLRRFFGKSRVRSEWENLTLFKELGIPVPEIVAYGQERKWGIYRRGAVVLAELVNTENLANIAKEDSPLLKNPEWIRQIILQIADYTRRFHDQGFIHSDLKWRNILVRNGERPQVFFIDCPSGRKYPQALQKKRMIKDLACLDKVAKKVLSKSQRMMFYKAYCSRKKLIKSDKKFIRKILIYFHGRE